MKKMLMITIMLVLIFFVKSVSAEEEIITAPENITVKYYKITTITNNTNLMSLVNLPTSYIEEISEEEYNMANSNQVVVINGNVTVENSYAKLTTSISTISAYYRYNADIEWKSIPSTRSYDVIGIGFPSNVKKLGGLYFEQTYCTSSTNCNTSTSYVHSYSSTNGVGITFKQPTGSLYSLTHHMHFNVAKNTTSTIYSQHAYGEFAHANTSVSLNDSKKYTVNTYGIAFENGIGSYYNKLGIAEATWSGTW